MRIAVTDWNGKISPVFDEAHRVLIFNMESDENASLSIEGLSVAAKAKVLDASGITVLLCGAISNFARQVLAMKGIKVHAWLCGSVNAVFNAYREEMLDSDEYTMPGCYCLRKLKNKTIDKKNSYSTEDQNGIKHG